MIEGSAPHTLTHELWLSYPLDRQREQINGEEERLGRELGFEETTACVLT
jgi:peptidoglycan/xylan/chitin deacetylase (PgdA/CDA1 family)